MAWKLIEVPDDEPDALTDSELVGMSVALAQLVRPQLAKDDVYLRAWEKIQWAVQPAIDKN